MKFAVDIIWALAPLVAFLNRVGGAGAIPVRRFGIPLALIFFAYLYHGFPHKRVISNWLTYGILAVASFFAFSLPLTLIGDSVQGQTFNFVWLWLIGPIQAFSLAPLFMLHKDWDVPSDRWRIGFFIHTIIFGSLATLSNTWGHPEHAWFEILIGLSYGGVAAWIINKP